MATALKVITLTGSSKLSTMTSVVRFRSKASSTGPVVSGITSIACLASSAETGMMGLALVSVTKDESKDRKVSFTVVASSKFCLRPLRSSTVKVILTPVKFLSVLLPPVIL